MKRLLLILAVTMTLSAWGQAGLEAPKSASGTQASSGEPVTYWVLAKDGQMHKLRSPVTMEEIQKLGHAAGVIDMARMSSQAGCPIKITDVSFERPAELMLTSRVEGEAKPKLNLEYGNFSGKQIQSIFFTGWIS